MAAESTRKSTGKGKRGNVKNLIPWKPGQSGNPKGLKPGTRHRRTVILDAIRRMAEAKGIDPVEVEDMIQAVGVEKALRGSFFHYETISDGLYGKITDKMDVTSGGKTVFDLIATANANRHKKAGKASTEVQG